MNKLYSTLIAMGISIGSIAQRYDNEREIKDRFVEIPMMMHINAKIMKHKYVKCENQEERCSKLKLNLDITDKYNNLTNYQIEYLANRKLNKSIDSYIMVMYKAVYNADTTKMKGINIYDVVPYRKMK